ncbi:MAG: gluconolaconase [Acidobacteria bacterium]|nr:gluconolaconase [Acidobacteriota bacterium]
MENIISNLLQRRSLNGKPVIEQITPRATISGGELQIRGHGFSTVGSPPPQVQLNGVDAGLTVSSDRLLIARIPESAVSCNLVVNNHRESSDGVPIEVGVPIAENMHPVGNPAIDRDGNIFVTFSGSRGQKVPVGIYKIDPNYNVKAFLSEVMNPTGMAFDRKGDLFISSRFDGNIYRATPSGEVSTHAEGMGVATGIAFDGDEFLYVGDRSGTIFKIAPDRQIFVFATLEPSISAYHLAFGPDGYLYVTGPTTSSFDCISRISRTGVVEKFYQGVGRPQGMAFDVDGNLYVAASQAGRKGILRINQQGQCELVVSGPGLVGLAFTTGAAILVTTGAVYHLNMNVRGRQMPEKTIEKMPGK